MLNELNREELTTAICYLVTFCLYVVAQMHFAQVHFYVLYPVHFAIPLRIILNFELPRIKSQNRFA
jgi:hypothetical protein